MDSGPCVCLVNSKEHTHKQQTSNHLPCQPSVTKYIPCRQVSSSKPTWAQANRKPILGYPPKKHGFLACHPVWFSNVMGKDWVALKHIYITISNSSTFIYILWFPWDNHERSCGFPNYQIGSHRRPSEARWPSRPPFVWSASVVAAAGSRFGARGPSDSDAPPKEVLGAGQMVEPKTEHPNREKTVRRDCNHPV